MSSIFNFFVGLFELAVVLGVLLVIIALWGYNTLRRLSEGVKEAWSNISVVTRKKVALVNQLIDVVKGYQESEKLVMLKVSDDLTVASVQQAYQQSGNVLSAINGMAQRYPELKSGEQYSQLIKSIQTSEDGLERARAQYNGAAKQYNIARTTIPHVFYSGLLGFRSAAYLNMDAVESEDSAVQRPMISDDGERVNELLGKAGGKMLGAAKRVAEHGKLLAEQGKLLAEKGATRLQGTVTEFHYLDAQKNPKGPVTRADLDRLYQSGEINDETDLLPAGAKTWGKFKDFARQGEPI